MKPDSLTGKSDQHIDRHSVEKPLHSDVIAAFCALKADAARAGFDLAIASGFRDFSRQLSIWNAKASGERQLLSADGTGLDVSALSPWQSVQAILRWSALPGASRHHWGTDLDIYDRNAVDAGYSVQLTVEEVFDGGPFEPLHNWLDTHIASGQAHGFFRPYAEDAGGIAPERWHLSFAPLAVKFQSVLSVETVLAGIQVEPLLLKDTVAEHIEEIFRRFVWVKYNAYPKQYQHLLNQHM